jgi:uncharacterized protein (TIGR03067 family)
LSKVFFFVSSVSFCTAFLFFGGCKNNDNPASAAATTELEGTWSGHIKDEPGISVGIKVQGNAITYTYEGMEMYRAHFTLDNSVTPHRLDAVITSSSQTQYVGRSSVGIYQLANDTLQIAGNEPGMTERPTSFTPSGDIMVMILTRQ